MPPTHSRSRHEGNVVVRIDSFCMFYTQSMPQGVAYMLGGYGLTRIASEQSENQIGRVLTYFESAHLL